ncbi:ribosomal protein S9/S16-domain-containing protein [Powellomyces hirtus]|nr:ribosomal protein S9/S16-domain-containing protein [Powellomyces hirtus]
MLTTLRTAAPIALRPIAGARSVRLLRLCSPVSIRATSSVRTYASHFSPSGSSSGSSSQSTASYKDVLRNPHPVTRPDDLAYFTGNPRYFASIMALNTLIRKHPSLGFRDATQYEATRQKPKWMSMMEMQEYLEFKLVKSSYDELIHKLNILYTVQGSDPEVSKLLQTFVKPGAALVALSRPAPSLDEFSRSYSYGSRKTARAQAWIVPGDGQVYVNGTHISEYFAEDFDRETILRPLVIAKAIAKYNIWSLVKGGGQSGQAAAVAVAIARGVVIHDPLLEPAMKEARLITIDTRQVERKKTGQPGARKKNTWVKR